MGMDLILAFAEQRHPERSTQDLMDLIDNLTEERAHTIFESVMQIDWDGMHSEEDADGVVEYVQQHLRDAVEVVQGVSYSRSVATYINPDKDLVLAIGGGESWGDTPEGFDDINFLAEWGEW